MADSSSSRGPARETRLLLLTLFVSVAVLFLLARFRFPERPLTDLSPPQPLGRLTRGLALDELSASLTELLRRVEPSIVVLRVASTGSNTPGTAAAGAGRPGAVRLVAGIRVRDELVLAPLGPDDRAIGLADGQALASDEESGEGSASGAASEATPGTGAAANAAAGAAATTPLATASGATVSAASGSAASGSAASGPAASGPAASGAGPSGSGAAISAAAVSASRGSAARGSAAPGSATSRPGATASAALAASDAAGGSAAAAASTAAASSEAQLTSGPPAAADGIALPPNAIVARDELRGLALVRVPARSAPVLSVSPPNEPLPAPGYVAVLEASPVGPTIRAEFVSSLARAPRPGWDTPALLAGGVRQAQRGALLFTLTGRFVGIALTDAGGAAVIAPADTLLAQVDRLARGESLRRPRPGFDVQPLTPALARATGAGAGGVIVSAIAAPGPDGPPVALGDVITAADDQPIRSPIDWQRALQRAVSSGAVSSGAVSGSAASGGAGPATRLDVIRFGQTMKIILPLGAAGRAAAASGAAAAPGNAAGSPAPASAADASPLGATFRTAPAGTLDIVSVTPAGAAARAGLRAGDRVTALLPARGTITAARLAAAFTALKPGGALVLAVDRPEGATIVALPQTP